MKRTVIIVIITLIVLSAGFVIFKRKSSAKADAIQTSNVQRSDFRKIISSSGKTAADVSVDLKFQTSGKLAWVKVKEGDSVSAYQAIAGMDVREVQKTLKKTLIDYSSQRNIFEDTRKYDTQASTAKDALNDQMKHILEENQWDLDKAVLDVELKHLALEYATLVTPIAGIVTHLDTPVAGINITPANAVFRVVDPESVIFEANVDEMDIGALSIGQETRIFLDAYPEASFSGTISFISYSSEQSSGGSTVFPVKIAFRDTPENFRVGLNGDIEINTHEIPDVITVPLEAIREEKGDEYVYRKIGDSYQKSPVSTGLRSENDVVVTSGLEEGDVVVTKGFSSIPK